MSHRNLIVVALLATLPALASAQTVQPVGNALSLSDTEKAQLLSQHTEESVDAARSGLDSAQRSDRHIHGEIGALIGSHGTRAAYGTATVPLGENSEATVAFERSRSDRPY